MLTAVRLQNFKNHIDTEVRLGRLTCLVGPNGCGKTSVLEGVQFACTTLAEGAVAFFQRPYLYEDFTRKGSDRLLVEIEAIGTGQPSDQIAFQLTLGKGYPRPISKEEIEEAERVRRLYDRFLERNGSSRATEVSISHPQPTTDEQPKFHVRADWKISFDNDDALDDLEKTGAINKALRSRFTGRDDVTLMRWQSPKSIPSRIPRLCPTAFFMIPEMSGLRAASYSPDEIPALSSNGATLASVIAYLITTEPDRFAELLARIHDVLPTVERLRVRPAKVELTEPATVAIKGREIPYLESREVIGHELLFDLKDAPGIPARAVSEGTLLVTALLTATVWNQGADVLLIDDLDKGLHPKAQRELVATLKALLAADPRLQIAFSTHSPYVVDELEADQVWILVPDEQRGVVARRLSEHPRAADALKVLTTGEFLSAEGEDWVREIAEAA